MLNPIKRAVASDYWILGLSIAYFLAFWPFTPGLATADNLGNLLITLLPLFIVAMGQTVVLITGGIDLSVTSIMALASVAGAAVLNEMTGLAGGTLIGSLLAAPVGIVVMLGVGMAVGVLNGLAITGFRMPPFIVTLTSMTFFSGLAIWLTQSKTIYNLPPLFNALGGKLGLLLPICLILAGLMHLMLSRSLLGRWFYAVGHNATTARISGVPVAGVTVSAYALSGLLAGMAAVLYTGQSETGDPTLGQRMLLDIIAATVIGGASLFGGRGKIFATLLGVIFIKLLDNSLNLLDLSHFTIMMVKGGVILLAALLDALKSRAPNH
jgi:ribose/xylose/arabinose/galactoside ABC-type transport system permease subunit